MGIKRCKLSRKLQLRLLENFVLQVTARSAADLHGIQVNTVALFYRKIRLVIAERLEAEAVPFTGEIEVDEGYFGGVRKGPRGRGAAGKVPVFGLLKRGGKVYALPLTDTKEKTLLPIIRRKIRPDSVVYTDGFPSYNVLDVSEFHHVRINHAEHFANGRNHINGIENFWNQAKRWLSRYDGIPRSSFPLFLKEVQFRFNYGSPLQQLKTLRAWCKI
jgi:transposase